MFFSFSKRPLYGSWMHIFHIFIGKLTYLTSMNQPENDNLSILLCSSLDLCAVGESVHVRHVQLQREEV